MPHPLTEASNHAGYFTLMLQRLLRRSYANLKHSAVRYHDSLKEVEESYQITIGNPLDTTWQSQLDEVKHNKESLSSVNVCWSSNKSRESLERISTLSQKLIDAWRLLADDCRSIKDSPRSAPPIKRDIDRAMSECDFIKKQLLPDISDCKEKYQSMKELLSSIKITRFSLNMKTQQIRLFNFDQALLNQYEGLVEGIEWFAIDCQESQESSALKNCRFTECVLTKSVWEKAFWVNVSMQQCSGTVTLIDSNVSLELDSCSLLCLKAIKTQIKSLSINNSNLDGISIKEKCVIDLIESTDSSWCLSGEEGIIHACQFRNSKVSLKLSHCNIEKLLSKASRVYVESTHSGIKKQRWDQSNAWVITHEDPFSKDRECCVVSGSLESHQSKSGKTCLMIFEENTLRKTDSPPASYAQIGRVAVAMNMPTHEYNSAHNSSLLHFRHCQILWVLKHAASSSRTGLYDAIATCGPLSPKEASEGSPRSVLVFFQKNLTACMLKKPIGSCLSIEEMHEDDQLFVLECIVPEAVTPSSRIKAHALRSVDLDTLFCQHMMESLSVYNRLDGRTVIDRHFNVVQRQLQTLISKHMLSESINPRLITAMIHAMLRFHVSINREHRTCSDYLVNYLVHLSSWYLSIRIQSDALINQLNTLLHQGSNLFEGDLLKKISFSIRTHCPLIASQNIHRLDAFQYRIPGFADHMPEGYKTLTQLESWQALSTHSLEKQYLRLVLNHVDAMLDRYRPAFICHPLGRDKLATMRQLVSLIREGEHPLVKKISNAYRHIDFLLGGRQEGSCFDSFREARPLHQGNTRPTRGYVTTLFLARSLLKEALCEKSFHLPGKERCAEAVDYFGERGSVSDRIRSLVTLRARKTIRENLFEIKKAIETNKQMDSYTLKVKQSHQISLDKQLELSLKLSDVLFSVSTWGEAQLKQVLLLWYCYERRENSSLKTIEKVSLWRGKCIKYYHNKEGLYQKNGEVDNVNDHIQLTSLRQQTKKSESFVFNMIA